MVHLSGADRVPTRAIVASGVLAAAIFSLSTTHLYLMLVAFTTAGFYIAFSFPVLISAWLLLRGQWPHTPFSLGAFTGPVILAAAAWIVFETVNIAWPRVAAAPWYESWSVLLMALFLGALGIIVRTLLDRKARRLLPAAQA